MKYFLKQIGAFVVAGSVLISGVAHAGILTNGGFESGFDGWEQSGSPGASFVEYDPSYVHSGAYAAFLGEVGGLGSISQHVQTTIGQTYSLKFWLSNMGGGEFNEDSVSSFALFIGGDTEPALFLNSKAATFPTPYDVSFLASSSLTKLEFSFRHDDTFWALDDVSMNAAGEPAPVPEPATLSLLIGAFAAWRLTGARRVRSERSA